MSILLSNEIMSAVTNELKTATESVQIITAYCKENAWVCLLKAEVVSINFINFSFSKTKCHHILTLRLLPEKS